MGHVIDSNVSIDTTAAAQIVASITGVPVQPIDLTAWHREGHFEMEKSGAGKRSPLRTTVGDVIAAINNGTIPPWYHVSKVNRLRKTKRAKSARSKRAAEGQ